MVYPHVSSACGIRAVFIKQLYNDTIKVGKMKIYFGILHVDLHGKL